MYARLVLAELSVYPDTLERVKPVLQALKKELQNVKGLNSYTLFNDWDKGEVGLFALWESKEAEQKAWERMKGKLDDARDVMWRGRPLFKLFDVYEHGPTSKAKAAKPKAKATKAASKLRPRPAARKQATGRRATVRSRTP